MGNDRDNVRPGWKLFLLSLVSLFLELLVIRWMAADIRAFSVFKSFPLVTFYVGLGAGLASTSSRHARFCPYALLFFVAVLKLMEFFRLGSLMFPSMASYNWQSAEAGTMWWFVILFMPVILLLLAGPFLAAWSLGSQMAPLFNSMRPLSAYSINLAGALSGSVLFALLSFGGLPPWVLLIPPAVILVSMAPVRSIWRIAYGLCLVVTILLGAVEFPEAPGARTYWSPYQRLDLVPATFGRLQLDGGQYKDVRGLDLMANHGGYQRAIDLLPDQVGRWDGDRRLRAILQRWTMPYQLRPADDLLIVGAGLGSDVAQALFYGAKSIDAVDIDPAILKLGKDHHPLKPYASTRVRPVCDDARHFFNTCKKKYDLIVFSHLDSHTVLSVSSSVRLDNYIYTQESLKKALGLLKPGGILVLSFCTKRDWFTDRLYWTIRKAAGYAPLVFSYPPGDDVVPNTMFVAGDPVRDASLVLPAEIKAIARAIEPGPCPARTLTDDWPYLYLDPAAWDLSYMLIVAEIVAVSLYFSRGLLMRPAPPLYWQLFFMGAAFVLLELQLISRLSLLFGSTWLTTSIVINGLLTMILIANLLVLRQAAKLWGYLPAFFCLLIVSLAASLLLPVNNLIASQAASPALLYALVCLVTFLPALLSAICFAVSFTRVADSSRALAFNLLGGVIGALCEYAANFLGVQGLLYIVIAFYAAAFAFFLRARPD